MFVYPTDQRTGRRRQGAAPLLSRGKRAIVFFDASDQGPPETTGWCWRHGDRIHAKGKSVLPHRAQDALRHCRHPVGNPVGQTHGPADPSLETGAAGSNGSKRSFSRLRPVLLQTHRRSGRADRGVSRRCRCPFSARACAARPLSPVSAESPSGGIWHPAGLA